MELVDVHRIICNYYGSSHPKNRANERRRRESVETQLQEDEPL